MAEPLTQVQNKLAAFFGKNAVLPTSKPTQTREMATQTPVVTRVNVVPPMKTIPVVNTPRPSPNAPVTQPPTTTPGATSDTGSSPLDWLKNLINQTAGTGAEPANSLVNSAQFPPNVSSGTQPGSTAVTGLSDVGKLALLAIAIFGTLLLFQRRKRHA